MLVYQYELFKMLPSESITSMFTRMTIITNSFDALVMTYTNAKIMSKIFRPLPKTWEAKVMAIQEAKDLTKLLLKELIGSLIIYKALGGLTLLSRVIGFERASSSPL